MKVTPVTLLFFVVSAMMLWNTVSRMRKDRIGLRFALVWGGMWLGIGCVSLFPELLDSLARLAMMRRIFFVVIVALFLLFALVFRLMSKLEEQERNQARLVRELSLLRHEMGEPGPTGGEKAVSPDAEP